MTLKDSARNDVWTNINKSVNDFLSVSLHKRTGPGVRSSVRLATAHVGIPGANAVILVNPIGVYVTRQINILMESYT